jgi:iron complex outermembrane receptor protein
VAGAVNITTRAPTKHFEGSVRGVVGNYGAKEVYGTVSGPIADKVLGKISVATENRDGFATNLFDGQKLDDLKRVTTRGQVSVLASDKLKINLFADYSDTKQNIVLGEPTTSFSDRPLAGGPLPNRVVNFNTTPTLNIQLSGASMAINYALDGGSTLTAISGYRLTKQDRINDTDYGPQDIFKIRYKDDFKQTSQEVRIVSPSSAGVRYVGGVYYLQETAETLRVASTGADGGLLRLPPIVGTNAGTVKTNTYALFGALDADLAAGLTLNLGARYTREKKDLLYNLNGAAALGIATLVDYTDSRSENKVTPTVGVTFAASKDLNLYAKYSTGFKSGGWNADYVSPAQVADGINFNTETVKSFEVGVKGKLLGGQMQYEVAAFNSTFKDYQVFFFVAQPNGRAILQLKNAAKVESQGLEASTRVRVLADLKVGASVGVLKTTYKSFPNGGGVGVDLSGQSVPDIPELTAALTLDYSIPVPALDGGFEVFADYSHRDSTTSGAGLPTLAARDLVNLRLTYAPNSAKWSVSLWARNLTAQDYVFATGRDFFGNNFVVRGQPRTFGVEAKYSF